MITLEALEQDPYAALGVRKFINATCHHTILGGTLIPDTSLTAMRSAAASAVDLMELQKAAGRVIANYTHADDGFIVSGCAAAMLVGTAAILTGTDRAKGEQLPDLTGMKSKCIAKRFARHRTPEGVEYVDHGYAIAVQTAGVKFTEIGENDIATAEEYDAAFDDDTAMVYWVGYAPKGDLPLADVIDIAHSHGVPVMVDASNSLPPRENLHLFIDLGADLVCFSGGKGLQGPQGSGIIAGPPGPHRRGGHAVGAQPRNRARLQGQQGRGRGADFVVDLVGGAGRRGAHDRAPPQKRAPERHGKGPARREFRSRVPRPQPAPLPDRPRDPRARLRDDRPGPAGGTDEAGTRPSPA